MTDRKYSVAEIDRMRAAVHENVLETRGLFYGDGAKLATVVEDRLRTYMLAGIGPEELED